MTVLQRLLKYPHAAVFDKQPGSVLAFRIQHPAGATWSVADGVMLASAGGDEFTYALGGMTVAGLCAALTTDGFQISDASSATSDLTALVLIEGSGGQTISNGDQVFGFTSLLWVILSAYAGEVAEAGAQVGQALRQMVMTQSEGVWLDLWGALYSVGRNSGEQDADYAERIPKEAFRVRVNKFGIEQAIFDATGYDVRIEEPWREIFKLDGSLLSGPDKIYDGENVGYHLIRPEARGAVDWAPVLRVIDRNRAAGVLVLQQRGRNSTFIDASSGMSVAFAGDSRRAAKLDTSDGVFLDYMMIEDVPTLNHSARHIRGRRKVSQVVVNQLNYAVTSNANRSYRSYYLDASYSSQNWLSFLTWSDFPGTWETTTVVTSAHTRS